MTNGQYVFGFFNYSITKLPIYQISQDPEQPEADVALVQTQRAEALPDFRLRVASAPEETPGEAPGVEGVALRHVVKELFRYHQLSPKPSMTLNEIDPARRAKEPSPGAGAPG